MLFETDHVDLVKVSCIVDKVKVSGVGEDALQDFEYTCEYFYSVYTHVLRKLDGMVSRQRRSEEIYGQLVSGGNAESEVVRGKLDASMESVIEKLETVCNRLQLSSVPDKLQCREVEMDTITQLVRQAVLNGGGNTIYVNGIQGIGKTATILQVVKDLMKEVEEDKLPYFEFVEMNGMKLPKPDMVYDILWKAIKKHDRKTTKKSSLAYCSELTAEFRKSNHDRPMLVLLVDEIDCLLNRSNTVLYNLLDWPKYDNSKMVVIGVANTMDLPERLESKMGSRFGVDRITFQPYTSSQIEYIIQQRLGSWDIFNREGIQLQAKRIASQSGDIRMALYLCKNAAERGLERLKTSLEENNTENVDLFVNMQDIEEAITDTTTSPLVVFLETATKYQCYLIIALLNEARYLEKEEVEFEQVYFRMRNMCATLGISNIPSIELLFQVCQDYEECRLILCQYTDRLRYPKLRLNLGLDEVALAWKYRSDMRNLIMT